MKIFCFVFFLLVNKHDKNTTFKLDISSNIKYGASYISEYI